MIQSDDQPIAYIHGQAFSSAEDTLIFPIPPCEVIDDSLTMERIESWKPVSIGSVHRMEFPSPGMQGGTFTISRTVYTKDLWTLKRYLERNAEAGRDGNRLAPRIKIGLLVLIRNEQRELVQAVHLYDVTVRGYRMVIDPSKRVVVEEAYGNVDRPLDVSDVLAKLQVGSG